MTFDLAPYKTLYPWAGHFLDVGQGHKRGHVFRI